jgi:hypothetical protein
VSIAEIAPANAVNSRRDEIRREESRTKFIRTAILTAFFAAVMGANLYIGAVMVYGALQGKAGDAEIARTGVVSKRLLDGTFCRAMTYDNDLAHTTSDRIVPCDELQKRKKGKADFNWGKE